MNAPSLRVAIIGSGPSGLYAADELLKAHSGAQVDMFDRLATPGGLARFGVSPDHHQRRKIIDIYERQLFASGRFRFFGNVEIGRNISHSELSAHYHGIIYSSGASADRMLNIPGEDLNGAVAATNFVAWYNGHPDHHRDQYDLRGERAVLIGNGNVALDVARMLLLPTAYLSKTDISEIALNALAKSEIKEVVIVGRRGPAQAAFTLPELLELKHLDIDIELQGICDEELNKLIAEASSRVESALRLRTLQELAKQPKRHARKLIFRFMHSPLALLGENKVSAIQLGINTLSHDGSKALATSETTALDTQLIIKAIGYRGRALPELPFDAERGILPNEAGRVISGVYVTGWLKRGPQGVIGSNKMCSKETVASVLKDCFEGDLKQAIDETDIATRLSKANINYIDIKAWRQINKTECAAGLQAGKPRKKILSHEELIQAAQPTDAVAGR